MTTLFKLENANLLPTFRQSLILLSIPPGTLQACVSPSICYIYSPPTLSPLGWKLREGKDLELFFFFSVLLQNN